MKRTTKSGLEITYAPFWLVWLRFDDWPERIPHLRVTRPASGNGEPLSEQEALEWWLSSSATGCTATVEAEEYLSLLRDRK